MFGIRIAEQLGSGSVPGLFGTSPNNKKKDLGYLHYVVWCFILKNNHALLAAFFKAQLSSQTLAK